MNAGRKPLVIGIELIDDSSWMGGTLYLRNLAICLSRLPAREQPAVRLIGAPQVVSSFLDEYGDLPIFRSSAETFLSRGLRRVGFSTTRARRVDVLYPGFGEQIPGAVTVRWIPDFQHRYLPALFSAEEILARDKAIGEIAGKPGVVVLSSEVAAEDFKRFYPGHRVTPRVWHFCSLLSTKKPASRTAISRLGLPNKYLYLPNQFWAHKNHLAVLKALAKLRRDHAVIIPLVCTGAQSDRRNDGHFASLKKFIDDQSLDSQIHFLGLIDRLEQIEVLRQAAAVVQPSFFEGWSTVVEDVRATGRPIFLSDLPVHREQAPEHCTYFDPATPSALVAALAQRWAALPAGPDAQAEQYARESLDARIIESARVFCKIAETAMRVSAL